MYTKILAQGTKFGSGTTGLDNPAVWSALDNARRVRLGAFGTNTQYRVHSVLVFCEYSCVVARRRVLAGAVSARDGAPPVRRVGRGLQVRHRRARCRARGRGQRAAREERTAPAALRAAPHARLHPLRQTHLLEHSAVRVCSRRMRLPLCLIHVLFSYMRAISYTSNLLGAYENFALPFMKCFQIEKSPHMNAGFSVCI